MYNRKLVTMPLPGDVACFLSRQGYTEALTDQNGMTVARQIGPEISALASNKYPKTGMVLCCAR
jgi:hypothetical protein